MSQKSKVDEILAKPQVRSAALAVREMAIDEENRMVELAFSSDAPIQHWFGDLILDHNPSSVRLDRLNSSGALL